MIMENHEKVPLLLPPSGVATSRILARSLDVADGCEGCEGCEGCDGWEPPEKWENRGDLTNQNWALISNNWA